MKQDEISRDDVIEMARQAGFTVGYGSPALPKHEAFAKLVAAKAIAKDREEFDIDELCARQNKIGYKQGYRAGQIAEREACAKIVEVEAMQYSEPVWAFEIVNDIRARGEV